EQQTSYPWDGNIKIHIDPDKKTKFALHVRIPGWASGKPVPGDLYHFINYSDKKISLYINGKEAPYTNDKGYAIINHEWKKGDIVELNLPMDVEKIAAKETVTADSGRIALQRGPLVYCVEGVDNNGHALNILLPDNATFTSSFEKDLLNGVTVIKTEAPVITVSNDGLSVTTTNKTITAIPYYAWCNRGSNDMEVWLPTKIKNVRLNY
ncbi:MAG: glycoside hydrolase family 127 protein, partial [Bacteroidetes bacterium]|nr:glycoside hydrolase family 127 protein [Bacteroidota bacterium]